MKANKKKIIVLVAMIVLLVATGCLNYFLNVKQDNIDTVDAGTQPTFFETYRSDRVTTREQEITYLDEIIVSEASSDEAVAAAESQKLALTTAMETELVIEGLIKAAGYTDCVVTISTNNVNVVVKDSELTLEEAAQIYNTIASETDFTAADVVIIPYV
ncbi:MAG: SpoIIIAH-like family protein [Clostridia bacterium]|nr:SpoIIIAH-like family protein [Clostridia bacterium]